MGLWDPRPPGKKRKPLLTEEQLKKIRNWKPTPEQLEDLRLQQEERRKEIDKMFGQRPRFRDTRIIY